MINSRFTSMVAICAALLAWGCSASPQQLPDTAETKPETAPVDVPPPPPAPQVTVEDADKAINEAQDTALGGDLTSAEERLKTTLAGLSQNDPNTAKRIGDIQYNLGLLAEWQGRYSQARRQYESALEAQPELGRAVVAVGRLMLRSGDASGAVNYARGRLVGRQKSIPLRNALNRLRLAANADNSTVESESKKVLREDEKNVDAMINLAVSYHRSGKFELAIAVLDNAKALQPKEPEIYWRLSQSRLALKDKLRARLVLEEATRLDGGATAEIYNNLGVIYHEAGDFSGAEIQFRKALARWPDMLAAQVNLGNALKGQQEFPKALDALKLALQLAPSNGVVAYNLGILLLDGQFPGMNAIVRLNTALGYFDDYKKTLKDGGQKDPVNAYIKEAKKRIKVEEKRAAQMKRMKAAKDAKAAKAAQAAQAEPKPESAADGSEGAPTTEGSPSPEAENQTAEPSQDEVQ